MTQQLAELQFYCSKPNVSFKQQANPFGRWEYGSSLKQIFDIGEEITNWHYMKSILRNKS